MCGKATMIDKIRLNKFFFQKMFIDDAKDKIKGIWNRKETDFFKRTQLLFNNYNHVLNKMLRENRLDSFILPRHTYNQIKVSNELRTELEQEYKLRKYFRDSKSGTLVHRIIDSYFGMRCFESKDTAKNGVYAWYWDANDDFCRKMGFAESFLMRAFFKTM